MIINVVMLILSLALILVACFVFTNAIEWFGKRLNLGEGVVGSVLAAIGTALPETVIPIIAIVFYTSDGAEDIGVGAIAGAPFMLGSLALFVVGAAVCIYTLLGKRSLRMTADVNVISRDLKYFIIIYGIAILTSQIYTHLMVKAVIAIILMLSYFLYLKNTFCEESQQLCDLDPLYVCRICRTRTNMFWIIVQLVLALIAIVWGAHLFVGYVEGLSTVLGITPLVLSMIITPIATELPEKLNSVIWTGRRKDTLALGNITGAMIFQSCFPVVFGMLFTPWHLEGATMLSAILALTSAAFHLLWMKIFKTVNAIVLMLSGLLYLIFIFYLFG
ncbi:sodium:calcium antiporter [Aminipila butyrica]|uniref:Sodium:calcium antiporter n=1 Tax=Aminipila butyrica TaxID=433296 RepID=A0A858BWS8_9FIRM|nr:sodium:calcium antiporter [Aminipila butyrica]QIB70541.1 sodium:calcium antiporter [Aminipila butyrica]